MKYNNILVAVDRSEEAEQVLMSAMLVAEERAVVHLLTVVEPLTYVYGDVIWSPILDDTQTLENSLIDQAKKHLVELGLRHGLPIENVYVEHGSPAKTIRAVAKDIGADLIVVGTHGRHGVGLILGSTANSVLHGAMQDVLVIRLSADDKAIVS